MGSQGGLYVELAPVYPDGDGVGGAAKNRGGLGMTESFPQNQSEGVPFGYPKVFNGR